MPPRKREAPSPSPDLLPTAFELIAERGWGGFGMAGCNLGGERGRTPIAGGPSHVRARRRPTLPGPLDPSTIGAGGLNFRVRNGNGCDPSAMATETCCQVERGRQPAQLLGNSIASTNIVCRSKPSAD